MSSPAGAPRLAALLAWSALAACSGCTSTPSLPRESPPQPTVAGSRLHVVRTHSGGRVVVELAATDFVSPDEELVRWVERAVAAVEAYFGRFPLDDARVFVTSERGRRVGFGQADSEGVRVRVGRDTVRASFDRDWVLTHEMIHLALPSLPAPQHWLEEGSATYIEPIARCLAGQKTPEEVWREFARDYSQGLPREGDKGLDHTPTWGRTYYGGALWCLLADVELRRQTNGRVGLQQALAKLVEQGASIRQGASIESLLTRADAATKTRVLQDLYAAHANTAVTPDLAQLWSDLGVHLNGRTVTLTDDAPLSAIRSSITPR